MLDRAAIFLILLFAMVSVAAYDHYLTSQGKVSPFARLIDYAGLGKYSPEEKSQVIKREIFNQRFSGLQETLQRIENKKAALVQHRKEVLAELAQANGLMKVEAENYQKIIDQEREQFLQKNPELKTKVAGLVGTSLEATLKDPQLDKTQVENFKNSIVIKQQAADKWQDILKTLEREDQVFAENTFSIEQQSQKSTEETMGQVKALVAKLETVTEKDWRELMKLYEDLWIQQEMLTEGAELTAQRLYDSYALAVQQMKTIEGVVPIKSIDMMNLTAKISTIDRQLKFLLDRVVEDKKENRRIYKEVWDANNGFFNNALVLHRKEEKTPSYSMQTESANTALKKSRPVMDNPILKHPKQPSIDQQLRPIRDKAKENGFYGHSIPSSR